MIKLPRIRCSVFIFTLACTASGYLSAAQPMVMLKGHVPKQIQNAVMLQRATPDESVSLSLAVRLDQTLLDQTLNQIYGPGAPPQKHYLSSQEFAQIFGLAEKRQALKDFAQAKGLKVDPSEDQPESMVVKVSGPASLVEKAFQVQLNHYKAADGQVFRAHETEPMIPASLQTHLGAVFGLSNYVGKFHSHMLRTARTATTSIITNGSGPFGGLSPNDIKTIYGLGGTALTGSGQRVALVELDGYTPSDITAYEAQFSLPGITVTPISIGGKSNTCGSGCNEVTLDIELVAALAPGVSQILVYEAVNSDVGLTGIYNQIATDNTAKAISTSWGLAESLSDPAFITATAQIFQRMAAQGQSMYAASGDSGAFDDGATVSVDDPASQQFVTGVGGTSLSGLVQSPTETAWNSCGSGKCLQTSGGSSGGGVSAIWGLPSYQAGVSGLASQTFRNVPDIALNADPNSSPYSIFQGGAWQLLGGTSAAAPLWASFTALLNQQNLAAGNGDLGFPNPTLYSLATGASTFAANFTDVKSGDNGNFSAKAGYDNVTGFGSFKGGILISSISGILAILAKEQLSSVYAYPNPWDTRKYTTRQVTLANVPADATVKIFTISGFWVKSLTPANGQAVWDLTNDHGDRVASGLYFYLVNSPVAKARGEIAIIK